MRAHRGVPTIGTERVVPGRKGTGTCANEPRTARLSIPQPGRWRRRCCWFCLRCCYDAISVPWIGGIDLPSICRASREGKRLWAGLAGLPKAVTIDRQFGKARAKTFILSREEVHALRQEIRASQIGTAGPQRGIAVHQRGAAIGRRCGRRPGVDPPEGSPEGSEGIGAKNRCQVLPGNWRAPAAVDAKALQRSTSKACATMPNVARQDLAPARHRRWSAGGRQRLHIQCTNVAAQTVPAEHSTR